MKNHDKLVQLSQFGNTWGTDALCTDGVDDRVVQWWSQELASMTALCNAGAKNLICPGLIRMNFFYMG